MISGLEFGCSYLCNPEHLHLIAISGVHLEGHRYQLIWRKTEMDGDNEFSQWERQFWHDVVMTGTSPLSYEYQNPREAHAVLDSALPCRFRLPDNG